MRNNTTIVVFLTLFLVTNGIDYYKLIGDTPKSYPTGGSFDKFSFEQIDTNYTDLKTYTASLWANRGVLANTDNTLFRISQIDADLEYGSRSPLVSHNPSDPNTLAFKLIKRTYLPVTTAGNYTIDFNDLSYYPQGVWTFFFFSMNYKTSSFTVYVLSYQWDGAKLSPLSYFQKFSHSWVPLEKNASMMVGGDGILSNCNCQIAQARFYPNFTSSDEAFIRDVLSYGEPARVIGLNFGAFQGQNSDQEVYFSDSASTTGSIIGQNGIISSSNDSYDMTPQPFGDLVCTGSTMLSVSTAGSPWHSGFLMHFWLKPDGDGVIISGQSSSGVNVFTISYIAVSQALLIQRYVSSWISFQSPPMSVTRGSWNEILVGFPQNYGSFKVRTTLIVNNTENYEIGWADEANPLLPVTTLTFCAGFATPTAPSSLFSGTIRSWMLYLGYLNFDTKQVTNCSKSVGIHNNSAYCLSCNDTNLLFNGSCFTECPKKTLYSTDGLQHCFSCNPNIQGDYTGYCGAMNTDNCLQYNSSKNSCDVCLPGYVFDNNICSTNCSDSSQVPIYKSGTCNQNQYLIAQIAGDDRFVPYNDTVVLDASTTQYPNNSSPLYYTWFCTKDTNPSLSCESNSAVKLNVRSTSPLLVIPSNTYPIDTSYNFSVKVESEDGNSSVYHVQLTFKNNTFSVNIEYLRPLYRFCPSNFYRFWVDSAFNDTYRYHTGFQTSFVPFDYPTRTEVMTYPRYSNEFSPSSITVWVEVVDMKSTALVGKSSVQFALNRPAFRGSINIAPASGGIPFSTPFQISADGWIDLDGGPLTYAFYYSRDFNFSGKISPSYPPPPILYTMIADYSSANQITTYLPNASPLKIVVSIKDATGCHSNISTVFELGTQIKDPTQTLDALAAFSKLILQEDQGTLASSIRILTDEFTTADGLLNCRYNNALLMPSCLTGAIPDRCRNPFHCSSNGQCSNSRCICDPGYYLADCSMNITVFNRQLTSRMTLINFATSYFSNSVPYEKVKAAADLMLALSEKVYLNTNDTYKVILNSLNALIEVASTYDQSAALQIIDTMGKIISNVIYGVIETSCGLPTNYSIYAVQKSLTLLSNLSDLYVKNVNNVSTGIILETPMVVAYIQHFSSSQLNNLVINVGSNFPQVQLGSAPNVNILPNSLIANYIYLKTDPLKCNDSASSNFTLILKDASSTQPVNLSINAKISYDNETFYWVQCDAPACTQSTDSHGNTVCDCADISAFNLTTQLSNYHNLSKLHAPTGSVLSINSKDPLSRRWSFWVALGLSLCLLLGLVIMRLVRTDFCIIAKITSYNEAKKHLNICYKLFVVILFLNPVCNLLIYKSAKIDKSLRLLLLYLREMSVLVFSGVFITQASPKTLLDVNLSLVAFILLAIPTGSLVLEKCLSLNQEEVKGASTRKKSNYIDNDIEDNPRKKAELSQLMTFWAAIVSLSLAIALFALAMLFSIKYSNDQVFAWLMNFVKAILIDLLVCPIAGLIIAFVLLKYTPPGKFNFLENFLGYNLCLLLRTLKWVPPRTKKEEGERGLKTTQSSKNLDQSVLALRTLSTISENNLTINQLKERSKGLNDRSLSLIFVCTDLDSQTLGESTDLEKKRFSSSGEEDEQGKNPEERPEATKMNEEWGNLRVVQEEGDDEEPSPGKK